MKINKIIGILLCSVFIFLGSNNITYALDNEKLSIDQKIGMNGHIDVPKDILYAGNVVREYHNFGWSITNEKKMFFNRFSWWDFDGYYKDLFEHGITILPCIQMGEQSIFNRNRSEKPVMLGDDTTDPMSYKIHSNYLFNYAARYGSTIVDESRLNLDSNETVKTGLGYITYYEDWNEPDKTWLGPDAEFNSTELAAMLSADYDGHEGRLGDTYGIKKADPNSKLVMGGMAGGSTMVTWLNEMQEWSNNNRTDKKLPLDVINYHQYAGTHSPENSTFVEDAQEIIKWRNNNAADKEIWITEFGWDTNPLSPRSAPTLETQRDWIIREYLIGDRIGLDRMTVYDALNDGPIDDATQYSTSGLVTKLSEGGIKKPSWYGVNTLKNTLKGYKFTKAIKEDEEMYIYKYTNGTDFYYVLWSPTEDGTIINNYNLNIDIDNYENASLTVLKDKEPLGVTSNLEVTDNKVIVNVSESPIFVKVTTKLQEENPIIVPEDVEKKDIVTPEIKETTNNETTSNIKKETINEESTEKNNSILNNNTTTNNEENNTPLIKHPILFNNNNKEGKINAEIEKEVEYNNIDNNIDNNDIDSNIDNNNIDTNTVKKHSIINGVIEDKSTTNDDKNILFIIVIGLISISIIICLIFMLKK